MLSEIPVGKECEIFGVKDASSVFLQYLLQLSVSIGTKIKVLEKVPFDESMIIQIDNDAKATVSKKFTESLWVD